MNSAQFLDAVKAKHALRSDYQAGKFLGIKQGRISMYRTGRRQFDDATCLLFAKALDLGPLHVIAEIQAERAKEPELERVWKALARMTKKATVAALTIIILGSASMAPMPADGGLQTAEREVTVYTLYALRRRPRKWLRRTLRRWFAALSLNARVHWAFRAIQGHFA